jgi:hypothetical protein
MSPLPTFATQPDEDSVLRPAIVDWLKAEGFEVYVDSLFDLVVTGSEDQRDKHLELKVRLSSQNTQCPLTLPQWRLLNGLTSTSALNRSALVVIYDPASSKYVLIRPARLRGGAQSTEPPNTSYVKKSFLDDLSWLQPVDAAAVLKDWLSTGRGTYAF